MIVTTPEKYDVVTRKGVGDTELTEKVKLLIIDEVHLLNEGRGSVIESIVARTLRQVESTQTSIRLVGLSATLPNYVDVAEFLCVNPYQGLFYFDSSFRPVPLQQHLIGVRGKAGSSMSSQNMNRICYEKVFFEKFANIVQAVDLVREGHQVMIFVHSRKDTVKTCEKLIEEASAEGQLDVFDCTNDDQYHFASTVINKSRNRELKRYVRYRLQYLSLFSKGFAMHHAGMLRSDRNLVEKYFEQGLVKVLCCTGMRP